MSTATPHLDAVEIASPCPAQWEAMAGDERVRFCPECRLHVYNLSGMTGDEAETLLQQVEGRRCVRFYRRADGKVMTADCPVGLAGAHGKIRLAALLAMTFLAVVVPALWVLAGGTEKALPGSRLRDQEPFKTVFDWFDPAPPSTMGAVCP